VGFIYYSGVWKSLWLARSLPFFSFRLKKFTTTNMEEDERGGKRGENGLDTDWTAAR
jgi:hypothetical protein